jgi:hypothetical protein
MGTPPPWGGDEPQGWQTPGQQPPGWQTPGWQTPPSPPPGYQNYSPYGMATPGAGFAREHPKGTTVLVLGILSLVSLAICQLGLVMGPIAWAMGSSALKEIDANPGMFTNRGSVNAGRICGIVATILLVLGVVIFVGFIGLVWSSPAWG